MLSNSQQVASPSQGIQARLNSVDWAEVLQQGLQSYSFIFPSKFLYDFTNIKNYILINDVYAYTLLLHSY